MINRRRLFWIILLVFLGLSAWWVFYFPYSPAIVYRAIPSDAVLISEHERLAERWQSMARNPLVGKLLGAAGVKEKDIRESAGDSAVADWVERLASRHTVVAWVPAMGRGEGESAWVLSSWVGGWRGQILRWSASLGLLKGSGLEKATVDGGREVWVFHDKKAKPDDPVLSVTLIEGVFLACLSRDPLGVRFLVDRIESGAALLPEFQDREDRGRRAGDDRLLDSGWIRLYPAQGETGYGVTDLRYGLTAVGEHEFSGWIRGEPRLLESLVGATQALDRLNVADTDGFFQALGAAPEACLLLPYRTVDALISTGTKDIRGDGAKGFRLVGETLRSLAASNAPVMVCMMGGDYSGRMMGLKVPALVAGIRVKEEADVIQRLYETLDRLNGLYHWKVFLRREEKSGSVMIDSGAKGLFGSLGAREKPAVTVTNGWLILSTCLETLDSLSRTPKVGREPGLSGERLERYRDAQGAQGYLWVDLDRSGVGMKNALAVYSLVLMVQDPEGNLQARKNVQDMKAWVETLMLLNTCRLRVKPEEDAFVLDFRMGK